MNEPYFVLHGILNRIFNMLAHDSNSPQENIPLYSATFSDSGTTNLCYYTYKIRT